MTTPSPIPFGFNLDKRPPLPAPAPYRRARTSYLDGVSAQVLLSLESSATNGDVGPRNAAVQELLSDPLVLGPYQSRLGSVGRRVLAIASPDGEASDPSTLDAVRRVFGGLSFGDQVDDGAPAGIRGAVQALASASIFGLSLCFVEWGSASVEDGAPIVPRALHYIDPAAYLWREREGRKSLHLRTAQHPGGVPLCELSRTPDLHFLTTRPSSSLGRPELGGAGSGLLRQAFLHRMAETFLLGYTEGYAIPALVLKRPAGQPFSSGDLADIQEVIDRWMSDQRVVLPPGFDASLLTPGTGGADLFRFIFERTRSMIDLALLGQDGTGTGAGGSRAKAEVNERTREDVIDTDCEMVAGALSALAKVTCAVNGWPGVAPVVRFDPPEEVLSDRIREKLRAAREAGLTLDPAKVAIALGVADFLPDVS